MRLIRPDDVPINGFSLEEVQADRHRGTTRIYLSIVNLSFLDTVMRIDTTAIDPAFAGIGTMFAEDGYLLEMIEASHLTDVQVNDAIFSRLVPLFFLTRDQIRHLHDFYAREEDILDVARAVSLPARRRMGWDILSGMFPETDFILAIGVWSPLMGDGQMVGHFTGTHLLGYTRIPKNTTHLLEHPLFFRCDRETCTLH